MAKSPNKTGISAATEPLWHASVKYKRWVRARMRERGWTSRDLAREVLARGGGTSISSNESRLIQFLGNRSATDDDMVPNNTALMPAINEVFGIAPPSIYDPEDPLCQIKAWIDASWPKLDEKIRDVVMTLLKPTQL